MSKRKINDVRPLPPNFIIYDHHSPSPLFGKHSIEFIESIRNHFNEECLENIRQIEWFILNTNTGIISSGDIPGLRSRLGMGYMYVKRFSNEKFNKMIDEFLEHIPMGYPKEDIFRCNMPSYRVSLSNNDKFYPIAFHGDIDQWQRRLRESADVHQTLLGHFDHGKFVVSDGRRFDFSALKVDSLTTRRFPKSW